MVRMDDFPTIEHYWTLAGAPGAIRQLHGKFFASALRAGEVDRFCSADEDEELLVARGGGGAYGVIQFFVSEEDGRAFITFGYVAPPVRRQGIYAQLWQALVRLMQARGVGIIEGGTLLSNTTMRQVLTRLGRQELYVISRFEVPSVHAEGDR